MMLLDVLLSFGAPKTADIQWLDNDMKGDGGFVFQIEILCCHVEEDSLLW